MPDYIQRAGGQASRDETAAARRDRFARAEGQLGPIQLIPIADIQERAESTRPAEPNHVKRLAQSIANLGLIEPLVVDRNRVLLAGLHRARAVVHLRDQDPEAYSRWFASGVPCAVRDDVDAQINPRLALEIEVAENEHRRDYTKDEIRELAERLKDVGYTARSGRPKKGEKSLIRELEVIAGKSRATLKRILLDDESKPTRARHKLDSLIGQLHKLQSFFPEDLAADATSMLDHLERLRDANPYWPDE